MQTSPSMFSSRAGLTALISWIITAEVMILVTVEWLDDYPAMVLLGWVLFLVGVSCMITTKYLIEHLLAKARNQLLDDLALQNEAAAHPPEPRFSVVDRDR